MQTVRMDGQNERLALLKALLGISGAEKDTLLEFALRTVEERVLGYIHWDTLPEGLERPLVLMTAAYWKGAALGGEQTAAGPVASVKRGDASTSFAVSGGASATAGTFDLAEGGTFFGWRETLNGYRRLRR